MALLNAFQAQNHLKYWNQVGVTRSEWVAMETQFPIAISVLPVQLLAYQASMVSAANWDSSIYSQEWEWMMSSVISFANFTHFSNLTTSGTNADISKWQMVFLIFPGILWDKPKSSRGFNLITVAL